MQCKQIIENFQVPYLVALLFASYNIKLPAKPPIPLASPGLMKNNIHGQLIFFYYLFSHTYLPAGAFRKLLKIVFNIYYKPTLMYSLPAHI